MGYARKLFENIYLMIQVAGIRFMWENIIQSVRKVKSGDKGLGCILAHTMGLGKTFQVCCFHYIDQVVILLSFFFFTFGVSFQV